MLRIATIARSAAVALAFALTAASTTALADGPVAHAKGHHGEAGAREDHAKKFPMRPEAFRELVARRTDRARVKMEEILADRKLPDAVAAAVRKDFEAGAAKVKAAAEKAAAKGQVTLADAKELKKLAHDLIEEARIRYGLGKGGHHKKGGHKRDA
jgi:hypothetical protein